MRTALSLYAQVGQALAGDLVARPACTELIRLERDGEVDNKPKLAVHMQSSVAHLVSCCSTVPVGKPGMFV